MDLNAVRDKVRDFFDLHAFLIPQEEAEQAIREGVSFRGINILILIVAIFIASLGLNTNSTAVIIGAMLISPLMGPIIGIGLAVGIHDFELMKRSFRNLAMATLFSVATSCVYFLLSPVNEGHSELLARTSPTIYDVMIGFFGGAAGILAIGSKIKGNVIPGVAIATALMPPLCTAGFGLATGQFRFFIGAFYLFFINTVFIALATYIIVRMLKYHKKKFLDPVRERYVKRIMLLITLVTFIPSVVIGLHMVRVSFFESAVDRYVQQAFQFEHTRVIECKKTYKRGDRKSSIELLLIGEPLGEEIIDNARAQLYNYGLQDAELIVRQARTGDRVDLKSLQMSYSELLDEKNAQIDELKQRLSKYKMKNIEYDDISREAGAVVPNIRSISMSKCLSFDVDGVVQDTLLICVVKSQHAMSDADRQRLRRWLEVRTSIAQVKLYTETSPTE